MDAKDISDIYLTTGFVLLAIAFACIAVALWETRQIKGKDKGR